MLSNIKAARALGWTSIAIGLTELAATGWVEDQIGIEGRKKIIRGFGLREIAAGVMILNQPGLNGKLVAGLWSRVAGDAVDLAALGKAKDQTSRPDGLSSVTAIVTAITGIDILVALRGAVQFIADLQSFACCPSAMETCSGDAERATIGRCTKAAAAGCCFGDGRGLRGLPAEV